MGEYKVEARASVPYAIYIYANSQEEAWEIAEEKAKSWQGNKDWRDKWSMTVDDFSLDVKSVAPVCRMRTFIPGYDD